MASTKLIRSTLNGIFFGIALTYSGLQTVISSTYNNKTSSPSRLASNNIYEFVLTLYLFAFATSALVIYCSNQLGLTKLSRREPANYGWFKFDGNVVGGVVQGVGMVMVRSEPGLIFVSVGQGQQDAIWTMLGGILGGFAFVILNERLKRTSENKSASEQAKKTPSLSHGSNLGIKSGWMLLGLEIIVISIVLFLRFETGDVGSGTSGSSWAQAVAGGALIGLAQMVSLILTRGTLGVSSAYPTLANHFFRMFDGSTADPGFSSLFFALGVVLSGRLSSVLSDDDRIALEPSVDLQSNLVGGGLLIFGARLSGGCTSGHGISGCGLLSPSSAVTTLSMILGALNYSAI